MKTDTQEKILKFIENDFPVTVNNMVEEFRISSQAIHRHLLKLISAKKIYKTWIPPKVYYFPLEVFENIQTEYYFKDDENKILKENFVYFWANGEVKYWATWFIKWCEKRSLVPQKEINFYIKTFEKYSKYKDKNGFIDGMEKMKNSFDEVALDKIFYLDFYSIEKYWKTLLWNLMLYAKQTNNKDLAKKILNIISEKIYELIKLHNIDSFAFIPPSIDRKVQLMDELEKWLNFNLKKLKLLKIFKDKPVPQKSLNKKSDRIINASQTIFIWDNKFRWNNILLIDDAVWSWATLNETAKKIKQKNMANKIFWLAIVGSYKGFEIINEV